MKIKEYLTLNKIITDAMLVSNTFLTPEAQSIINSSFKFMYGDLTMYYEEQADVEECVNYVLMKNSYYYNKIKETLNLTIPIEYQRVITKTGLSKEDILRTVLTGENSTTTTDIDTTHSNTNTVDGSVITGGTNTTTDTISETNTEKGKAFDSNLGFEDIKQNVNVGNNGSNVEHNTETSDDTITTDIGSATNDGTVTVEGNIEVSEDSGKTLDENMTEKEQTIEVLDRIEQYRELFRTQLWDVIIKDIKSMLCLRVWELE